MYFPGCPEKNPPHPKIPTAPTARAGKKFRITKSYGLANGTYPVPKGILIFKKPVIIRPAPLPPKFFN
jgi:hypothetical protein